MAGTPWEKYAPQPQTAPAQGPWSKYAGGEVASESKPDVSRPTAFIRGADSAINFGGGGEREGVKAVRAEQGGLLGKGLNVLSDIMPAMRFADIGAGLATELRTGGEGIGETYTQARNAYDQDLDDARQAHPVTTFGGELAASAVVPFGSAKATTSLAPRALKTARDAAVTSGIYGALETEGGAADRRRPAVFPPSRPGGRRD